MVKRWRIIVHWFLRLRFRIWHRVSGFAGLDIVEAANTEPMWDGIGFAYRLHDWPMLRPSYKTAAIYRALSIMSTRPVSVAWFSRHSGLPMDRAQDVVSWLVSQGYAQELSLGGPRENRHVRAGRSA